MTTLNDEASREVMAAGISCVTDVTGFGLLGHLYKMARASGVTAVIDQPRSGLLIGGVPTILIGLLLLPALMQVPTGRAAKRPVDAALSDTDGGG